ncbi:class I SAM-dependent methyltransferase [Streptomyces sp. MB09-01]|uniref:class I SAM-dependent methyltransferase n=1 Tax=Streptomyces sp. MB09-01 TaxID=3028666 RepID=UPI0029BCB6E5|nr:class I SAM-dependent methyltransferase [Streptomyces sp. MB09-01]MDX3534503.1 class I SAM-dependent methyltransferase [Streptomyces sp. MB09-01]
MTDRTELITAYWDAAAATFDEQPDHGLRTDDTRAAWARLLRSVMPDHPVDVLDIGCGTGSVSLLLAESGHRPTGVDLAPRMIEQARTKFETAGFAGRFLIGDAMAPPTGEELFDVVLSRHLVWTLPDPETALREWVTRVRPGGRLVLVEGRWGEAGQKEAPYVAGAESLPWNGGLSAEALAAAVRPLAARVRVELLSGNPDLWGGPVDDERYVLVAEL